ncbi:MAG: dockerin type I repeat-containing protein [Defluviitaleaceae bacterium]|nr:dockerin type I repeat-containing protein [Defluviitaleaceae bacterium]
MQERKLYKRVIALLMTAVLVLSMLPAAAFANEVDTEGATEQEYNAADGGENTVYVTEEESNTDENGYIESEGGALPYDDDFVVSGYNDLVWTYDLAGGSTPSGSNRNAVSNAAGETVGIITSSSVTGAITVLPDGTIEFNNTGSNNLRMQFMIRGTGNFSAAGFMPNVNSRYILAFNASTDLAGTTPPASLLVRPPGSGDGVAVSPVSGIRYEYEFLYTGTTLSDNGNVFAAIDSRLPAGTGPLYFSNIQFYEITDFAVCALCGEPACEENLCQIPEFGLLYSLKENLSHFEIGRNFRLEPSYFLGATHSENPPTDILLQENANGRYLHIDRQNANSTRGAMFYAQKFPLQVGDILRVEGEIHTDNSSLGFRVQSNGATGNMPGAPDNTGIGPFTFEIMIDQPTVNGGAIRLLPHGDNAIAQMSIYDMTLYRPEPLPDSGELFELQAYLADRDISEVITTTPSGTRVLGVTHVDPENFITIGERAGDKFLTVNRTASRTRGLLINFPFKRGDVLRIEGNLISGADNVGNADMRLQGHSTTGYMPDGVDGAANVRLEEPGPFVVEYVASTTAAGEMLRFVAHGASDYAAVYEITAMSIFRPEAVLCEFCGEPGCETECLTFISGPQVITSVEYVFDVAGAVGTPTITFASGNFQWRRNISGAAISNPTSFAFTAPGNGTFSWQVPLAAGVELIGASNMGGEHTIVGADTFTVSKLIINGTALTPNPASIPTFVLDGTFDPNDDEMIAPLPNGWMTDAPVFASCDCGNTKLIQSDRSMTIHTPGNLPEPLGAERPLVILVQEEDRDCIPATSVIWSMEEHLIEIGDDFEDDNARIVDAESILSPTGDGGVNVIIIAADPWGWRGVDFIVHDLLEVGDMVVATVKGQGMGGAITIHSEAPYDEETGTDHSLLIDSSGVLDSDEEYTFSFAVTEEHLNRGRTHFRMRMAVDEGDVGMFDVTSFEVIRSRIKPPPETWVTVWELGIVPELVTALNGNSRYNYVQRSASPEFSIVNGELVVSGRGGNWFAFDILVGGDNGIALAADTKYKITVVGEGATNDIQVFFPLDEEPWELNTATAYNGVVSVEFTSVIPSAGDAVVNPPRIRVATSGSDDFTITSAKIERVLEDGGSVPVSSLEYVVTVSGATTEGSFNLGVRPDGTWSWTDVAIPATNGTHNVVVPLTTTAGFLNIGQIDAIAGSGASISFDKVIVNGIELEFTAPLVIEPGDSSSWYFDNTLDAPAGRNVVPMPNSWTPRWSNMDVYDGLAYAQSADGLTQLAFEEGAGFASLPGIIVLRVATGSTNQVTFDLGGGNSVIVNVGNGMSATPPHNPWDGRGEGWIFEGWATEGYRNVTANTTVSANWVRVGAVASDGAGDVSSADIVFLARAVAGHTGFAVGDTRVADINGDGAVNAADITALLRWLTGYRLSDLQDVD